MLKWLIVVVFVMAPWSVRGQLGVRQSQDVAHEHAHEHPTGWKYFSQRLPDNNLNVEEICEARGYDVALRIQGHRKFSVAQLLDYKRSKEFWELKLLSDTEISFRPEWADMDKYDWDAFKSRAVSHFVIGIDERDRLWTPLTDSQNALGGRWVKIGWVHRQSWAKRRLVPIGSRLGDGVWHAFFTLFGH